MTTTTSKQKLFKVSGLAVSYRNKTVLENINFSCNSGQLIGIIGPNGAGKSTLVKALLGIIPTSRGDVTYAGKLLNNQRDKIAYIPQKSQIDWDYPVTVWDVVMMGRVNKKSWFRPFSSKSYQLADKSLRRLGIYDLKDSCIGKLSGGQQQRVFLAKALAQEAEIFCLDEPLSGVDYTAQTIIFDILKDLCRENKTIFVIHHDLNDLTTHFDKLLLMNKTIITIGNSNEVLQAKFLHSAYGE
nr:MntA [Porphyrostromium japonicum]